MGNNNTGMHMIWYKHYAKWDDLDYYDRLVEEKEKKKNALKSEVKTASNQSDVVNDQKAAVKAADMGKKMNADNVNNKRNQPKKINKNNQDDFHIPFPAPPEYGTERILDVNYLIKSNIVSTNLMFMALKRKIDIKKIMLEAEAMMRKDERTNAKPGFNNPWSWMRMVEKTNIYLAILADKLDCSIMDFFIDDESSRRAYIYKFISRLSDYDWDDVEIDEETGNAVIIASRYGDKFSETKGLASWRDFERRMDLALYKEIMDDGTYSYSIAYGSLTLRASSAYEYAGIGAYLWEEEEGELKDYIERLIADHPEWKE